MDEVRPAVASQVRLPPVGGLLKGRYALGQDDLGDGSFGAVYEAEDTTAPGTNVAVKVCVTFSALSQGRVAMYS
jgi:hypothetical protein